MIIEKPNSGWLLFHMGLVDNKWKCGFLRRKLRLATETGTMVGTPSWELGALRDYGKWNHGKGKATSSSGDSARAESAPRHTPASISTTHFMCSTSVLPLQLDLEACWQGGSEVWFPMIQSRERQWDIRGARNGYKCGPQCEHTPWCPPIHPIIDSASCQIICYCKKIHFHLMGKTVFFSFKIYLGL